MTPTPTPTQIQQVIQAMPAEMVMAVIEQLDREGWKVVPKEPTRNSIQAAQDYFIDRHDWTFSGSYRVMIYAAPAYAMRNAAEKEENAPYCRDCGSENMAYVEQHADSTEYRCRDCGEKGEG